MSKKPIYLMVTQFFPTPESWRGAYCYDFAKAVRNLGRYDVQIMVLSRTGGADYDYNGFHISRCRDYVWKLNFGRMINYPLNRHAFEKKLREAKIDVADLAIVHFHDVAYVGLSAGIKKRNPNLKVMLHFHNGGHPFTVANPRVGVVPLYSTLLYLFCRWSFGLVDIPVFVSERQRKMFGRWFPNGFLSDPVAVVDGVFFGGKIRPIRLAKSYVLHNGIDYEVFNPKGRMPHEGFVIGCVANIDQWKDQLTLLKAVEILKAKIDGLRVILLGSGPKLRECKEFVGAHGLGRCVEFKSEVDHLQLPEIYRSFDLFVLPSYLEGFCCAYMEAWGCGTPVMGCKRVCLDEAIKEDDLERWLIEPGDYRDLAEKIEVYWKTPAIQEMRHDYDMSRMVREFFGKIGL